MAHDEVYSGRNVVTFRKNAFGARIVTAQKRQSTVRNSILRPQMWEIMWEDSLREYGVSLLLDCIILFENIRYKIRCENGDRTVLLTVK